MTLLPSAMPCHAHGGMPHAERSFQSSDEEHDHPLLTPSSEQPVTIVVAQVRFLTEIVNYSLSLLNDDERTCTEISSDRV